MPQLFVDTHCHLDKYDRPGEVLAEARRKRVVVVAVTETPADFARLRRLFDNDTYLRPALGAHPLRAAKLRGRELESFFAALGQTDYVGEIGLDFTPAGKPTAKRQIEVFDRILSDRRIKSKVLTIHSRGAEAQTVEALGHAGALGILHWYTGSLKAAEQALTRGLYFSVNPSMLRSKKGRRLLQMLPKDRVLTETDGPYSTSNARPSRPSDVPGVVKGLAELWSSTPCEAAGLIIDNMARLRSGAAAYTATPA